MSWRMEEPKRGQCGWRRALVSKRRGVRSGPESRGSTKGGRDAEEPGPAYLELWGSDRSSLFQQPQLGLLTLSPTECSQDDLAQPPPREEDLP